MERGLDELIEWLLTEIGFSGLEGFRAIDLVKAVKIFYHDNNDISSSPGILPPGSMHSEDVEAADIAHASVVWKWLIARDDVIVVPAHLDRISLEEALALPEGESDTDLAVQGQSSKGTSQTKTPRPATKSKPSQTRKDARPCLHLSEQRQWKAIAGHGPDLKRIPRFEWSALVAIASVRDKGILQGDLVRLTGQDKRSLPTRTEALARKGYIIKQPAMLRGCRTSKLWLAQFAEKAKEEVFREGLPMDQLDLSRETLIASWAPVPFSHFYNGSSLDYLAIAQAFLAVVKAYGAMRYCDLRTKLDINERVPQMRGLAKSSRWFSKIGVIRFEPMQSRNGNKLFKDCVKYLRDPTEEEWRKFRATPKANLKVPSSRIRKKPSSATSQGESNRTPAIQSRRAGTVIAVPEPPMQILPSPSLIRLSAWTPYKPIINTIFEIIKRSGSQGSSNAQIGMFNLGWAYRKWIASMTTLLGLPRSHPAHLEAFAITAQLKRVGKTNTYQFFASNVPSTAGQSTSGAISNSPGDARHAHGDKSSLEQSNSGIPTTYTFPKPEPSIFVTSGSSVAGLIQINGEEEAKKTGTWHKQSFAKATSIEINRTASRTQKRTRRDRTATPATTEIQNTRDDVFIQNQDLIKQVDVSASSAPEVDLSTPSAVEEDRPTGSVYYGRPNSLALFKSPGRPRKSIVMVFKHPFLRNPNFFAQNKSAREKPNGHDSEVQQSANFTTPGFKAINESADENIPTSSIATAAVNDERESFSVVSSSTAKGVTPAKRARKVGTGGFKCDTCGNTWKNANGLEYHQTRSKSACNPDYVALPAKPIVLPTKPLVTPAAEHTNGLTDSLDDDHDATEVQNARTLSNSRNPPNLGKTLPSRRPKLAISQTPLLMQGPRALPAAIISKPIQLRNMPEASPGSKGYASSNLDRKTRRVSAHDGAELSSRRSSNGQRPATFNQTTPYHLSMNKATPGVRRNEVGESDDAAAAPRVSPPSTHYSAKTPSRPIFNPSEYISHSPAIFPIPKDSSTASSVVGGAPSTSLSQRVSGNSPAGLDLSAPKKHIAVTEKTTKSAATERRERVASIITGLLDENNHVFPGDRSLYLVLTSKWTQKFDDVGPPDWKTCQIILNKLEHAKVIQQQHFAFFDKGGETRTTSVISRVFEEINDNSIIADGVAEVKNKSIELYPDPYIPTGFSLSQKETELFDAVKAKYRSGADESTQNTSQWAGTELSTLTYEKPLARVSKSKAQANNIVSKAPRAKRTLQDTDPGESDVATPRKRKRTNGCEYWDTGRVARLIWNQKRRKSEWRQGLPKLQDPETGAWSKQPHQFTSSPDIDHVLDLAETQEAEAAPVKTRRRRLRRRQSINTTSPPTEKPNFEAGDVDVPMVDADLALDAMDDRQQNSMSVKTRRRSLRRRQASNVTIPLLGRVRGQRSWDIDILVPEVEKAIEASSSVQFMAPTTIAAFNEKEHDVSEEGDDDDDEDNDIGTPEAPSHISFAEDQDLQEETCGKPSFAPIRQIVDVSNGVWPYKFPRGFFMDRPGGSFAMAGHFPDSSWFLRQNLPQNAQEMIESPSSILKPPNWSDSESQYEEFVRYATKIETWELSPEGIYLLNRGTIAPEHIFISLGVDSSLANTKSTKVEWPNDNQFTMDNRPDEFLDSSSSALDDDELEPPKLHMVDVPRKRRKRGKRGPYMKSKKPPIIRRNEANFKTRVLFEVPKRHVGRWNKTRAVGESLGRDAETELVVAIVIIKKLAGGVDKFVDWGLLLQIFPAWSLAGLKRFWTRVGKERGNFIDAFSSKFESAFLEAYEKDEVPPIDYDNLENYDWKTLIAWATRIETHDGFELPRARQQFDADYSLTRTKNYEENWRQMWYGLQTPVLVRVDAVAGSAVTLPAANSVPVLDADVQLARSWIRALCNNTNGDTLGAGVRDALLQLGDRDKASLDKLLEVAVQELAESKVIAKVRQKLVGQVFKLNNVFERRAEKQTCFDKYTQAVAFKTELDESFRGNREVILPYNATDGAIMVMINLQAYGRIRLVDVKFPHVPFGFEPSNYEGRKFSKSYYQWDVRLVPTENYIYNEDLAVVAEARDLAVPKQGPRGEVPIWYDFFGNLDEPRWVQWLCMVAFALATKGLASPSGVVELLSPSVEEFEARLIIDWLDRLGLLERSVGSHGCTMGEWWWLALGKLVDLKGKGPAQK